MEEVVVILFGEIAHVVVMSILIGAELESAELESAELESSMDLWEHSSTSILVKCVLCVLTVRVMYYDP